jgi:DNA-binding NarL/FixJ family response regulator
VLSAPPVPDRIVRVLIADDHVPTRRDLRRILEADPRFEVCAEAGDAAAAVARAVETSPDLLLLDIRMPGSGLSALWEISARFPDARFVMLTVSDDQDDLFAALRGGAHGYLLKDIDPHRLPEALYDVAQGQAALPRALVSRIMDAFRDANPRRRAVASSAELESRLTSREWQVLDLLARDLSTSEIAERLVLTASAVRAHITAIVRKLDAENREDAIARFQLRSGN